MRIAIGCDHGAVALKDHLILHLQSRGFEVADFGTYTSESCDYPDSAGAAAIAVARGNCERGIVLCTSGIGVSICANKVDGIRCALVADVHSAKSAREHNDTNMLALGSTRVDEELAMQIVDIWLDTPFTHEPRHQRRIDKMMALEKK